MHISKLTIRNFRNFYNSTLLFKDGVNTLIGENGSGKTNALYAIRLLLDDNMSRNATRLRETDFNRSLGEWRGHWVIISIDFEELDACEGCQMIRHEVGHMTNENKNKGTYTYIFRPKKECRKRLFELSQNGEQDEIASYIESLEIIDDYESVFTGRATIDFSDDQAYSELVGNFESFDFPDPEQEDSGEIGVVLKIPLYPEVTCTFVKALRDVIFELRSYRNNPLLNLLKGTEKNITLDDQETILKDIDRLNTDISGLKEVGDIATGIQDALHSTVGRTYSPSISIQSALPKDIERLLQRLSLQVGDILDDGYQGDLTELSLGAINLIYLSLKILEYETKLSTDRVAHFLLIEEPEAHIHTHIQMTLFEKYNYSNTQVIVSTHSTHISSVNKIGSVNILAKDHQKALVFQPSKGLDTEKCARIERYLDAVRSTLLFAKGVLLVEGDAELILIPTLIKNVFGVSLDELGISLINMSSTVFTNIATIFHNQRIRRLCAILTDLDTSIVELPEDPQDYPEDDKKYYKACYNSQKSGQERQLELEEFCADNEWVETFYAEHTFEVDFLKADNVSIIVGALSKIYSQQARIDSSSQLLQNDSVEISGREILRLAKSVGKGWFALILCEHLDYRSHIPQYILKALAFLMKKTITPITLKAIGLYRMELAQNQGNVEFEPLCNRIDELRKLDAKPFLQEYHQDLPEDSLTRLLNLLPDELWID
jgi:putative ATP-dependent endonuclease of the OLD family